MSLSKRKTFISISIFAFILIIACSKTGQSESGSIFVKKDAPQAGMAAKLFGKDISENELNKNLAVFNAQLDHYEAQVQRLEEMAREEALTRLAADVKLSKDEYVAKEMEKADKAVGDKEVAGFLKGRIQDPDKAPPHIKKQVKGILHLQNVVAKYTKKNPVELYLKRPRAPDWGFKVEGEPTLGPKDAPVTIVEFSDFQCPYCARGADTVSAVKKQFGNKVRVVYKNYPLQMHPEAKPAAEAALCVNEQSPDKFWSFHDKLFANQDALSKDDLKKYAGEVKADVKKFEECFDGKKYAPQVQASMNEGQQLGVNSTPSFFINNQPVRGAREDLIKEIIEEELKIANK